MKKRKHSLKAIRGWTVAELRQFKKLYPMSHNSDLAERLGRTIDSIRKKAIKLGLKKDWAGGYRVHQPPQNENSWTPEQFETLRRMYLHSTTAEIAAALNRSPMAVQSKIRKLGLYQEFNRQGLLRKYRGRWSKKEIATLKKLYPVKTKSEIVEEMGRSIRAVSRMITKLQLSGKTRSVAWTAKEDEFLEKYIFTWSVEKIAEKLGRGCRAVQGRAWRKRLLKQTTGWSKEEIQQLKYWLPKCTRQEIADKLGRSLYSVARKIKRLGLKKKRSMTPKEIAILKKFFPIESNAAVAQRLGVSPPTVAAKARELGLFKSVNAKYLRNWRTGKKHKSA